MSKFGRWVRMVVACVVVTTVAWGGPVILGGDDLTDHGSRSGSTNLLGWLYLQNAISSMNPLVTRSGPFTTDIAAIGSANPGVGVYPAGNAGGAINSVGNVLGLTVTYYDGAASITSFFTGLAAGTINPRIIWLAGDSAANDMDATEIAVVNANAAALNAFVGSGGGLMSHGDEDVYGWLSTLIPGIIINISCVADPGATLTAAGTAAFPLLTNANINAGPCHNTFQGSFGSLAVLALDGSAPPRALILGGLTGAGGVGGGCATHVHSHTFSNGHGTNPSHGFGHSAGDPRHGHHFTCTNHLPGHSTFPLQADPGEEVASVGFVAGLNEDGSLNGEKPARRGSVLQLFGSAAGLLVGEIDRPAIHFTPPASAQPLFTTEAPEVRVAGVPAKVLFSGLAPGMRGVWQINVLIPAEAPGGASVPVTVLHEGREVRSVAVSVEE